MSINFLHPLILNKLLKVKLNILFIIINYPGISLFTRTTFPGLKRTRAEALNALQLSSAPGTTPDTRYQKKHPKPQRSGRFLSKKAYAIYTFFFFFSFTA